jgi:hypothetical protein
MKAPFIPNLPAVIYSAPLPALPIEIDIARAINFAKQDKAESTRRAYKMDFDRFRAWCAGRHVAALPATPETVAAFLASEAECGLKLSTIGRRCAAKLADLDHRIAAIDGIISGAAQRGRANTAQAAMADQSKARAALVGERQRAAEALAALKVDRGGVEARAAIAESEAMPLRFAAELLGMDSDSEKAIRLLIALMVLCCDPLAIALTAAVSAGRS